jgi:hypothetical protein
MKTKDLSIAMLIISVVKAYQKNDISLLTDYEKHTITHQWAIFAETFNFELSSFQKQFPKLVDLLLDHPNAMLFDLLIDQDKSLHPLVPQALYERAKFLSIRLFKELTEAVIYQDTKNVQTYLIKFCNHIVWAGATFEEFDWVHKEVSRLVDADEFGNPHGVDIDKITKYYVPMAHLILDYFRIVEDYHKVIMEQGEDSLFSIA